MNSIPAELRRLVIHRAGGRCEYCRLAQAGQEATFHVDHIIPSAAGGPTVAENLALACVSCSKILNQKQFEDGYYLAQGSLNDKYFPIVTRYETKNKERLILAIMVDVDKK